MGVSEFRSLSLRWGRVIESAAHRRGVEPPQSPPRGQTLRLLALLVVALGIVAAAVYAMVGTPTPPPPAPFVTFGTPQFGGGGNATVGVDEVSREAGLGTFRVELRDVHGARTLFSGGLRAGVLYTNGSASVAFRDETSAGRLSVGDGFSLSNLATRVTYSLLLIYEPEGRTVASATVPL